MLSYVKGLPHARLLRECRNRPRYRNLGLCEDAAFHPRLRRRPSPLRLEDSERKFSYVIHDRVDYLTSSIGTFFR